VALKKNLLSMAEKLLFFTDVEGHYPFFSRVVGLMEDLQYVTVTRSQGMITKIGMKQGVNIIFGGTPPILHLSRIISHIRNITSRYPLCSLTEICVRSLSIFYRGCV